MLSGTVRRILLLTLGWVLVGLGVIGLALPFLQGVLMILAGLAILSRESRWVRRHVTRYRRAHPELDRRMREVGDRLRRAVPSRWRSSDTDDLTVDRDGPAGSSENHEQPDRRRGVAVDGRDWQNVPTESAEE